MRSTQLRGSQSGRCPVVSCKRPASGSRFVVAASTATVPSSVRNTGGKAPAGVYTFSNETSVSTLTQELNIYKPLEVLTTWENEYHSPYAPRIPVSHRLRKRVSGNKGVEPASAVHGFATAKGPLKSQMQDFFVAVSDYTPQSSDNQGWLLNSGRQMCVTGVYDGHGSCDHAARTAQERTLQNIASDPDVLATLDASTSGDVEEAELGAMRRAFSNAFGRLDGHILWESAQENLMSGSTALVSLQVGAKLFVANAGDSRAVLSRGGSVLRLSRDHSPHLWTERSRIEAQGGRVANIKGTWRVILPNSNGNGAKVCAVSRALGDRDFKEKSLMTCEPDVSATVLQPHRDGFVIHASDGLWGVMDDQEAVDAVNALLREHSMLMGISPQSTAAAAAWQLLQLAQQRGSMDDITVVITMLNWSSN